MMFLKNKMNIKKLIIVVIIILIMTAPVYTITNKIINDNAWAEKEISGQFNEMILFNQFPNTELLVTFTDGDFLLITKNHLGSYAFLSLANKYDNITISYMENGFKEVYAENITINHMEK